jgi:prevent-host-death family protein
VVVDEWYSLMYRGWYKRRYSMAVMNIDLENDIQPVSDFRANAASVIERLRDSGRPVVLTQRGRGTAVLVDIRRYQSLLEELELLRDIQAGLLDAAEGRTVPHDEAMAMLRERFEK